ncbi:MAG: hypothetical protein KBD00_05485 [Candidatus Peribacteraceae bacterium]|nr:hypothetical protein [Candidatus Peribacteraceae bacterium]
MRATFMAPRDALSTVYMDEMYGGGVLYQDFNPYDPHKDSKETSPKYVFEEPSLPSLYNFEVPKRMEAVLMGRVAAKIKGEIGEFHKRALYNVEAAIAHRNGEF